MGFWSKALTWGRLSKVTQSAVYGSFPFQRFESPDRRERLRSDKTSFVKTYLPFFHLPGDESGETAPAVPDGRKVRGIPA